MKVCVASTVDRGLGTTIILQGWTRGGCAQLKFRAFQKTSRAMHFAFERHPTKGSDHCG